MGQAAHHTDCGPNGQLLIWNILEALMSRNFNNDGLLGALRALHSFVCSARIMRASEELRDADRRHGAFRRSAFDHRNRTYIYICIYVYTGCIYL